jgi:hypothetical protein
MAADPKDARKGSSGVMIGVSVLLALAAGGAVYYFYGEAAKARERLIRSKEEYRTMVDRKHPVEEFLRQKKGRATAPVENTEDLMTFLDKKARESQIPSGIFNPSKNSDSTLTNWKEVSYTIMLQSPAKDSFLKKSALVDFLRKVETERRTTKVKSLQLSYSGYDFKSASITISQFQPK